MSFTTELKHARGRGRVQRLQAEAAREVKVREQVQAHCMKCAQADLPRATFDLEQVGGKEALTFVLVFAKELGLRAGRVTGKGVGRGDTAVYVELPEP